MGAAIFVVLVVIAVAVIGFLIYGLLFGLLSIARAAARLLHQGSTTEVSVSRNGSLGTMAVMAVGAPGAANAARVPQPRVLHCWETKECSAEGRKTCPAAQRPEAPCWLACMQARQALKPECMACKRFNLPMMVMQA